MSGEIISMENAEKIANYDKVISQRDYYKTEYEMLKINYQKLVSYGFIRENNS